MWAILKEVGKKKKQTGENNSELGNTTRSTCVAFTPVAVKDPIQGRSPSAGTPSPHSIIVQPILEVLRH